MLSRPMPPERSTPRQDRPPSPSRTTRRCHRRLSFSNAREQPDFEELQRQVMQETGLRLYGMKGQKKRELWQFVRLLAQDEAVNVPDVNLTNAHARKAYCLKCRRTIDFRTGKHFVKQHMEVYHPSDLERFNGVILRSKNAPQNGSQDDDVDRNLHASFDEVADHEPARAVTQEQQTHVNKLLAKLVACHFRPMVIVEDKGFVGLVRFITEDICRVKLKLPKRTQLRHEIVVLMDVKKSAGSKTNPLEWWRVHKTAYPILIKLARKWLGAVAASVPSERALSTSGNVVTVKRGSLTPEMVRNLVFVSTKSFA